MSHVSTGEEGTRGKTDKIAVTLNEPDGLI